MLPIKIAAKKIVLAKIPVRFIGVFLCEYQVAIFDRDESKENPHFFEIFSAETGSRGDQAFRLF